LHQKHDNSTTVDYSGKILQHIDYIKLVIHQNLNINTVLKRW